MSIKTLIVSAVGIFALVVTIMLGALVDQRDDEIRDLKAQLRQAQGSVPAGTGAGGVMLAKELADNKTPTVITSKACGPFYAIPDYYFSGWRKALNPRDLPQLVLGEDTAVGGHYLIVAAGFGSFDIERDVEVIQKGKRISSINLESCK